MLGQCGKGKNKGRDSERIGVWVGGEGHQGIRIPGSREKDSGVLGCLGGFEQARGDGCIKQKEEFLY